MRVSRSLAVAAVLAIAATARADRPSTVVGDLHLHALSFDGHDRTIRIWLPPGYDASETRRYPVLFMFDGQNCFDAATSAFGEWQIDETLTRLAAEGSVDTPIVVGIDHGGEARIAELTMTKDRGRGGDGERFEQFVLTRVVPFVRARYGVRANPASTVIGGSSLGGLMALEMGRRHPDVFGKILAMSPSLWWDDQTIVHTLADDGRKLQQSTVYLDMGQREGPDTPDRAANVAAVERIADALSRFGIAHRSVIDAAGEHNEASWSRRFPAAIQYLLPPPTSATTAPAPASPG